MEIYITSLEQILSFSSRFRRFEMKNFLRRPTMVANNITQLVVPQIFFHFYGSVLPTDLRRKLYYIFIHTWKIGNSM